MQKRTLILLILILAAGSLFAQNAKEVQTFEQVWLAYCNQTRFSERWGVWLDLHLRTKDDFFSELSTLIIRPGLTYYLNDQSKLTLGYAFVNNFPADGHKNISRPEHRIWQQFQWHTNYNRIRTMQWLRLEERYRRKVLNDDELGDGYNFNFRIRYNFLLQYPLNKKGPLPGTLSLIVNDELHINFGKEIVYNTFDQNRFFLGLSYQVNKSDNLQFGYMHMYQQLASGYQYRSVHAARVFYFHNLDLRKK